MRYDLLMLFDKTRYLMIKTTRSTNRLYEVKLQANIIECLQLTSLSESSKWHARLGHINTEAMNTMLSKGFVTGIPDIQILKETCVSCLLGKQTRKPFPQATSYRATQPLELVHGDLCGPISPPTSGQKRYVFVLIDDFTRYMWSILLEEKSEAFTKFKIFIKRSEAIKVESSSLMSLAATATHMGLTGTPQLHIHRSRTALSRDETGLYLR